MVYRTRGGLDSKEKDCSLIDKRSGAVFGLTCRDRLYRDLNFRLRGLQDDYEEC